MAYTLYIIADGLKTKIGITSRPLAKRLKEYDTHNPHWKLFDSLEMEEETAKRIERSVKAFFKQSLSASGGDEWFDVPASTVDSFVRQLLAASIDNNTPRIFHTVHPSSEASQAIYELQSLIDLQNQPDSKADKEKLAKEETALRCKIREEFANAFGLGLPRNVLEDGTYWIAGWTICPPDLMNARSPNAIDVKEAIWRGQGRIDPPPFGSLRTFFPFSFPFLWGIFCILFSNGISTLCQHWF